jgi:hypothetical protein
MISCQTFRATLRPGSDDATVLEHLRACDACLAYAVQVDPDTLFRSMGGGEMTPPGGVEAFVDGVMAQVRLRQAEGSMTYRLPLNQYLRAAAAVLFLIAGATGLYRYEHDQAGVRAVSSRPAGAVSHIPKQLTTKPIVETYQSQNATIVEVPTDPASDARVVMIFDESLPADL